MISSMKIDSWPIAVNKFKNIRSNCSLIKNYFQICNIHDAQILLTSSNSEKSQLLNTEITNESYHVNKPYHVKSKQAYHSIPYFERNYGLGLSVVNKWLNVDAH